MSFLIDSLTGGNKKALREQGQSTLTKTPTTVVKQVEGDYTRFLDIAIDCTQFVNKQPVTARIRVGQSAQGHGVRLSIGGRDGNAAALLTTPDQVDELIERLKVLKVMEFGEQGVIE